MTVTPHFAARLPRLRGEIDFVHDPITIPYRTLVASQGPFSWYRLNEGSGHPQDASGNGRHGTLESLSNLTRSRVGAITGDPENLAWLWTAVNAIDSPLPPPAAGGIGVDQGYIQGLSWEGWFKTASLPASGFANDVPLFLTGAGSQPGVFLASDGAVVYRQFSGWSPGAIALYAAGFQLNLWNQVVLRVTGTHDGSGSGDPASVTEIWVNGVMQASSIVAGGYGPNLRWMDGGVQQADVVLINQAQMMRFAPTAHPIEVDELSLRGYPLAPSEIRLLHASRLANYFTSPTYEDVSPMLRRVTFARGRQAEAGAIEPSALEGQMVDGHRNLEPEHPGTLANYDPNPSFEAGATWVNNPDWTPSQTSVRAKYGTKAMRLTHDTAGADTNMGHHNPTLTAGPWCASIYIWIPASYDGAAPGVSWESWAGATVLGAQAADLSKRDQWQRIWTAVQVAPGDLTGAIVVRSNGNPSNGQLVDVDGFQLEPSAAPTGYVDGDQENGRWEGTAHAGRSYRGGKFWPNVKPGRQFRLTASGVEGPAATGVTLLGDLVTDAIRIQAIHGDGRPAEGSIGIWEATVNNVPNGNAASDVLGWTAANGALSRDEGVVPFWYTCFRFTCTAAGGEMYASPEADLGALRLGMVGGETVTLSAWVYVPSVYGFAPADVKLQVWDRVGAGPYLFSEASPTALDTWQRVTVTRTIQAGATEAFCRIQAVNVAVNDTIYFDGVQLEDQPIATPFVHTDGGPNGRSAGRVQYPANLLDETIGAVAIRLRMGFAAAADPHAGFPPLAWLWAVNANEQIRLEYDPGSDRWKAYRLTGGAGAVAQSAVQTFVAGDLVTVIVAWTATQLKISVNGGAFVAVGNTSIPNLAAVGLFEVGQGGALYTANWIDSDVLALSTWSQ